MQIPLLDLKRQYTAIQAEVETTVCSILASGNYIMGSNVKAFEEEFATYCGIKHAISVANGTDGLVIALKALNVGTGDEVITTPYTFFATAESISAVGATPVFVDVRPDTYNIDENLIEAAITERTKAIMPVHIFGQPAEMNKINEIAKKHDLAVIEDACQAVGAKYNEKRTGGLTDLGVFSFFPTKNLGCAGDGGMITTNDDNLATICRALRVHGSGEGGRMAYNLLNNTNEQLEETLGDTTIYDPRKYYNYLIGHNSRLDEIQAAILRIKLKKLDEYNNSRQQAATYYNQALAETAYVTPAASPGTEPIYHQYILQSENRAETVSRLAAQGIGTGIYYPVPLHLQKAYKNLNYKMGDLPVSEYLSHRTFAIPCFPELTVGEKEYIIAALRDKGTVRASRSVAEAEGKTMEPSPCLALASKEKS
ncbi:MAG: DegT/DnrJ/EryC1/StrS family aminotransferase [Syntrophomonas sp.]